MALKYNFTIAGGDHRQPPKCRAGSTNLPGGGHPAALVGKRLALGVRVNAAQFRVP